jgi:hypothetical protein
VQAWIVERGAKFDLGAPQLMALADAGVPGSVTDVMIGASYPERFALQRGSATRGGGSGAQVFSRADSAALVAGYLRDRCSTMLPSISMAPSVYDNCRWVYGYRGYSRYMYNDYLYGYGYSPYGYGSFYGAYGPAYYGNVYYSGPVVIVRGSGDTHGRVVNGRGYERGETESTRGTGASATSSGSSGSSSSGSGSSSSGSSSSGAASSGRTAHPRPPA